ncbi:NAD(P)-binding domain-containing protein [Mycobacterium yunnanensis]|uniref:NAD(P)-binding domain-containing protein n=1 Tax=Mycobacterium yunnanensis TaxID=368477 RepID=A0A9X2YXP5_9MYCO|nr:NAD(P)-binding domain-containing protein [Mycobacterium yunnanensis]MCV7420520.1 NAD(P)-binding domain-containing protein [Mycobacterium yunnanensis]
MEYAVIGSGAIGTAIASQFARTEIEVAVATSKGPDAVAPLRERLGEKVVPAEVSEALAADVVILAVPFEAVQGLVSAIPDWNRRIIVDATNAIDYTDFSPADLGGRASSDLVAEWAVNARVVKAFGNTWAKVLARDPGESKEGRRVAFISGNEADANARISALATQFGFEPIDLGRNDAGGLLHSFGGPLTGHSLISQPIAGNTPPEMDLAGSQ